MKKSFYQTPETTEFYFNPEHSMCDVLTSSIESFDTDDEEFNMFNNY